METNLLENNLAPATDTNLASPDQGGIFGGMPSVIIPKPFVLAEQDPADLDRLKESALSDVESWESKMTTFFQFYEEFVDNWRVISRRASNKPRGLFNSKSAETHRASETMATVWFRMLTAADPFFEAVGEGLDDMGRELTTEDLYAAEAIRIKHLQRIKFKEKLKRGLSSLALFGTQIFEAPYVTLPYGDGEKYFEGTDLIPRSLLTTGFNPFVYDIDMSDFIFTIDFPSINMLKNWASQDKDMWNGKKIEELVQSNKDNNANASGKSVTYNRVINRKQRAGYNILDNSTQELVTRHGRIDINNPVVGRYWEANDRKDDPAFCDFSMGILRGEGVVRFNATPFKTWRHLFKVAHYKLFELEPLGYGVGSIGRKRQKELDATESQANNLLMFALLSMWKVGKYAGLNVSQLTIKPWAMIEMEDITQLEPIKPQIEALQHALQMQNIWREDFRTSTGASTNLQAGNTGATATEATLTQNESIRSASVHAEIIADSFLRDYLETSHINDLYMMEQGTWVKLTGMDKPVYVNRDNLPVNIGFHIKTTTDKDFRPERLQRIEAALNLATSIRNMVPTTINVMQPLFEEYFRALGMNPRLLNRPAPVTQQLQMAAMRMQNNPQMLNQLQSEMGGAAAGSGPGVAQTPSGPVATSPLASKSVQLSA